MNKLATLIGNAVRRYIDPDARMAVLLSGGIDSSTVAAFAPELPAFTGWYEGERYDERRWAELAAGERDWAQVEITPQDFCEHFDECLEAISPPFGGPGTFGQYMVAKSLAQEGIEVVLTGEGGDELFGGYARLMMVAGPSLLKMLGVSFPDGYEDYQIPDGYPKTLKKALAYDWDALGDLLHVDEEVNGHFGIEVRPPMLDGPVVEWVMDRPPEWRVGKFGLRRAMRGIVPDAILDRKDKRGFPVPYVEWAQREPVKSFLKERIGYVPDPAKPWSREWWNDAIEASRAEVAA